MKLKAILEQEKNKISFTMPLNVHKILLPLCRFRMEWAVKNDLDKYRTIEKMGKNESTIKTIIIFACYLFQISPIFRKGHRILFKSLGSKDFQKLIQLYGDHFTSTLLQEVMEEILNYEDALLLPERIQDISQFYLSEETQRLYERMFTKVLLDDDDVNNQKLTTDFATVFVHILNSRDLLKGYLTFFQQIIDDHAEETKANSDKIRKVFETLCLICHNIGTSGAYDSFLKFCQKFSQTPAFLKIVDLACRLAVFKNPELFHHTFSWAYTSNLDISSVQSALVHSTMLLGAEDSEKGAFFFERYMKYLQDKEKHLIRMDAKDMERYFQKAVEFFLE